MRYLAALLIALMVALPGLAAAERRVALVIGNDAYDNVPVLLKAGNDARAMEQVLGEMGFEVISAIDASRRQMNRALQSFSNRVKPGDVAMLFYAGHAIEIDGENFLLPVDIPPAEPGQEGFVRDEAISLNRVLEGMRRTGARLNIAVLDACRDNPFEASTGRSVGGRRGLSRIVAPGGTFVMYSADAGQAALDRLNDTDPDPNSVFTRTLLPLMQKPGLDLVELARETRRGVNTLASTVGHQQTPAYYDAILGEFAFTAKPSEPKPETETTPTVPPQTVDSSAIELVFWQSAEKSGTAAAYQTYLDKFPEGAFADLARLKISELSAPTGPSEAELAAIEAEKQAELQRSLEAARKAAQEREAARIAAEQEAARLEAERELARLEAERELAKLEAARREAKRQEAERKARESQSTGLEQQIARFKAEQRGPSYDCAKARRRDEIMICNSADLSALDRIMAKAYSTTRKRLNSNGRETLKLSQRSWLKKRASCRNESCLRTSLVGRIEFLEGY
ncbi:MAG: caspase family protein [Pseudomonadota bacterium]